MSVVAQRILVVGGNGFVGSAVCRAALSRGIEVTSISSSGRPYKTPNGQTPAWAERVEWRKADALNPESYADILPGVNAVVHTIGTLLDNTQYKQGVQQGNVMGTLKSLAGRSNNPLTESPQSAYDTLNYESAVRMCETFVKSKPIPGIAHVRPFIYISAEDIGRPMISVRYIETKREAEKRIEELIRGHPQYRGVYVRPGLIYHPQIRPMTSLPATVFDFSARVHAAMPYYIPMPASVLRWLGTSVFPNATDNTPSALTAMANLLTTPPIHLDHLSEAICVSLDPAKDIRGALGVRELIALSQGSQETSTTST